MIVAGIAKRITPPVEVILFTSRLPGWGNLSIVRPSTVPEKQGSRVWRSDARRRREEATALKRTSMNLFGVSPTRTDRTQRTLNYRRPYGANHQ